MNKLIILSDIHGNLSALKSVVQDFRGKYQPDAILLLGDLIDYGMRSNEVVHEIIQLGKEYPFLCNLCGNHEVAMLCPSEHLAHFSSERGKKMLAYTIQNLLTESISYIQTMMDGVGKKEFILGEKKILCVHGSLKAPYWGKIDISSISDESYSGYDYVFSGHTHIPHYVEMFYQVNNPEMRNRKKTIFLNPGSVGQPRNQNPCAQYLYVDISTGIFHHNSVEYDVATEQALYTDEVDIFYRDRLSKGI